MVDISRDTEGVYLPEQVASEIWADAQEQSVIMSRARQVSLPGGGAAIPVITGDPVAEFVAETDNKPVSRGTLSNKVMTPYKIAVIEPFSMEFRRDLPTLYSALRGRLGGALAKAFDAAALHGTNAPSGGGFDHLGSAPTSGIGTSGAVYDGLIAALSTVSAAGGDVSAFVLAPQGEITVLSEKDGNERPLFTTNPQTDGSIGSLVGRPVYKNRHVYEAGTPETLGVAGDWGSAVYGTVQGIQYSVSNQATLDDAGTQLNLWQRNMFAVRAEIEVGFVVRDVNRFVRLTNEASGS